jgi:hypothetical protein
LPGEYKFRAFKKSDKEESAKWRSLPLIWCRSKEKNEWRTSEQFGWIFLEIFDLLKLYRVGQSATSPSKIGKIFSKKFQSFCTARPPCLTESWIFYSRFVSSRRVRKMSTFLSCLLCLEFLQFHFPNSSE